MKRTLRRMKKMSWAEETIEEILVVIGEETVKGQRTQRRCYERLSNEKWKERKEDEDR